MAFVQKSIITMALGLDSMQRAICPAHRTGLCAEMLPVNGSILLQHLMNVSFSFLDEEVYFDEQGDPPGKYEILNFRRRKSASPKVATNELDPGTDGDETKPAAGQGEPAEPGAGPDEPAAELTDEPEPAGADFSAIESSTSGGQGHAKPAARYDSYSTLRVFRPPRSGVGGREQHLAPRRRRQTGALVRQAPPNVPESYSATSDYEYVQVGSWKSSDGLSLFGEIHWPSRSVTPAATPHWSVANDSSVESTYQLGAHLAAGAGSRPPPKSVCSLPCARGHAKVSCVWSGRRRACI